MSDQSQWRSRRSQSDSQTPNLLRQLVTALGGLWRLLVGHRPSRFNSVQLLADFSCIEQLLDSYDSIHAAQAIVRADSFLDDVMKQVGGQGATFADRLRSLESRFEHNLYQHIWNAHKLRNNLAHNHGTTVDDNRARIALKAFRRAASALGAF